MFVVVVPGRETRAFLEEMDLLPRQSRRSEEEGGGVESLSSSSSWGRRAVASGGRRIIADDHDDNITFSLLRKDDVGRRGGARGLAIGVMARHREGID